jgi:hypothetical protein
LEKNLKLLDVVFFEHKKYQCFGNAGNTKIEKHNFCLFELKLLSMKHGRFIFWTVDCQFLGVKWGFTKKKHMFGKLIKIIEYKWWHGTQKSELI